MGESYKLIDLVEFQGTTKEGERKTYYIAIVYFSGKGHNDLLKIVLNDKTTFEYLQECINQDITENIKVEYNSYQKVYKPLIKIF